MPIECQNTKLLQLPEMLKENVCLLLRPLSKEQKKLCQFLKLLNITTFQNLLCLTNYKVNKTKYYTYAQDKNSVQKKKTVSKTRYYNYKLGVSLLESHYYVIWPISYCILELL